MLYGEAKFRTHDYRKKSQKSEFFVPPPRSDLEIVIAREPKQSCLFNENATHLVPLLAGLAMTGWRKGLIL